MKYKLFVGLIAAATITAPVGAKSSSSGPLAAVDPVTLQAIAAQLKAQSMAEESTPTTALQSVETEIEEREEKAERNTAAKAGFYRRLAMVLGIDVALIAVALAAPGGITNPAISVVAHTSATLVLWAAYECSPLVGRAFDYLMEAHQDQAE